MSRLFGSLLLAIGLLQASPCRAQVITNRDFELGLSPGATYVPNDGAPFTQNYNYHSPSMLYINGNPNQLRVWDYEDRVARALKFGYKMPTDSPFRNSPETWLHPAPPQEPGAPGLLPGDIVEPVPLPAPRTQSSVGFGSGLSWFRRR